jgi:hypothetical protein
VSKAAIRKDISLLSVLLRSVAGKKKTLKWETAEQAQHRKDAEVRLEHTALKRLNPKCSGCVPYNLHHAPDYWGAAKREDNQSLIV